MENIEIRQVYELNENLAEGFRRAVESNQTRLAFEYVAELLNELYIHLGVVEEFEEPAITPEKVVMKKVRRTKTAEEAPEPKATQKKAATES